jgi:hypothetical protein
MRKVTKEEAMDWLLWATVRGDALMFATIKEELKK